MAAGLPPLADGSHVVATPILAMLKLAPTVLSLALLSACTGTGGERLINSYEGLTSEVDSQGSSNIDQNLIFSISGSLPQAFPGQILRFKSKRNVSTAFGIVKDSSGILVREVAAPPDAAQLVVAARDAILAAQAATRALLQAEAERTLLQGRLPDTSATTTKAGDEPQTKPAATPPTADELRDADTAVRTARTTAEDALDTARKAVSVPGLVVVRWDTKNGSTTSAGFGNSSTDGGAGLAVDTKRNSQSSGYMILAGLREATLFVGDDLQERFGLDGRLARQWRWGQFEFPFVGSRKRDEHVHVTTRIVQAKFLLYLEDSATASALGAQLRLAIDKDNSLGDQLKELRKLQIELAVESAQNLSNVGMIAGSTWQFFAFDSAAGTEEGADAPSDLGAPHGYDPNGWQTFYSTDADLAELLEMFHRCAGCGSDSKSSDTKASDTKAGDAPTAKDSAPAPDPSHTQV